MPFNPVGRLKGLLLPFVLLTLAILSTIVTLLEIIFVDLSPFDILNSEKWRDRAFKKMWTVAGPAIARAAAEDIKAVVGQAYGTVVDVGPGSGLTIKYFDKSKLNRVWGVEPNTHLHPALREQIKMCGLEGVYEIVSTGIEDFETLPYTSPGSVDSIVCVHVLCSVPDAKSAIARLYQLLKPGGQMLVLEHHVARKGIEKYIQRLFNIVWPPLLGGCSLTKDTDLWLREVGGEGGWEQVDLGKRGEDEGVVPEVIGRLVKAG